MDEQKPHKAIKGNGERARSATEIIVNRYRGGKLYRFILDLSLSSSEKFLLAAIAGYFNTDAEEPFSEKSARPCLDTIAKDTGLSRATVKRGLNSLCDNGFLQKERRTNERGADKSNVYSVELSLPAFYEYFEMSRKLKELRARDRATYSGELTGLSSEIWRLLRLDALSFEEIQARYPGLYNTCILPWITAEKARGNDLLGADEEFEGEAHHEPPEGEAHHEPPGRLITNPREAHHEPPGGSSRTPGRLTMSPKVLLNLPTEEPKKETKSKVKTSARTKNENNPQGQFAATKRELVGRILGLYRPKTKQVVIEGLVESLRKLYRDEHIVELIEFYEARLHARGTTMVWASTHPRQWAIEIADGTARRPSAESHNSVAPSRSHETAAEAAMP